jgi:NADH-quinone oxidoreductase subunit F
VDLHHLSAAPTDDEREAIDAVLPSAATSNGGPSSLHDARALRHLLLPALHAAQNRRGFVSEGALGHICARLGIPPAEAFGVASFYALLALHERPATVVHVCDDIACKAKGADALCDALERDLGSPGAKSERAKKEASTWERSPCLGLCERAPAAMVVRAGKPAFARSFGGADVASVKNALRDAGTTAPTRTVLPQSSSRSALRLLRRVGVVDPTSLADYRAHGGYSALRRAIELSPLGVIREVTESKLVGRGGAAFPTGRKWEAVARNVVRPHHLVCNADESEPGTFKDRVLMEEDPFALLEAMTIAGFATGSEHGFIYLRAEYPLAAERLQHAIDELRTHGFLGDDVMGKGFRFDVEIRRGAGAYICGEETALFNSIEGFRGEPRNKPPFPVDVGLFGKPTVVNNVETLVNVLTIVNEGAAAYRSVGTEGSPGTRLFCLCGNVQRPGLYEAPFGTRLDALIDLAGGVGQGRSIQTVLLGGAAGTFLAPSELSVPLTFEDTRKIGATLGSGVVMVLDDTVPLAPILARIAAFFRHESCGQCVPCRVGTVRQDEMIARMIANRPLGSIENERALLKELGQAMRDASICGLGQTASSAIESAMHKLPIFQAKP